MTRTEWLLAIGAVLAGGLLGSCGKHAPQAPAAPGPLAAGGRKVLYWYDPMQPGTHFDHPGKSPFMDMDLVPKYAEEAVSQGALFGVGTTVTSNPGEVSAAGVRTAEAQAISLFRTIRAVGTLEADETRLTHIAARVAGRLDRLYVDFTGETVRQGAPLYAIYSPDLVTSEREYTLALENLSRAKAGGDAGYIQSAESLAEAARERLALWGLDREEIERLARGTPRIDLVVRSAVRGTVLSKNVVEGQYVTEGQDLYLLADLSNLWLSVKIYEQDLDAVRTGQLATIRFPAFPGRELEGRIRFIDPVLDLSTRTAGVRLELPNPRGLLKPGMFANAELRVGLGRKLAIPRSAVIDTGVRQVVYVMEAPGRFVGREVRLGARAGDLVEVVAGLSGGERVVTAASFLLDAQSQLATGQSVQWSGASEAAPGGSPR